MQTNPFVFVCSESCLAASSAHEDFRESEVHAA